MKSIGWVSLMLATTLASLVHAEPNPPQNKPIFVTADRVAARYYAPETGGASRPRFLTQRTLAFEARLISLGQEGDLAYQDRHVRTAIDLHIGRDLLAELPLEHEPDMPTLTRISAALRQALIDRIGEEGLAQAAAAEGIGAAEIDEFFRRDARAAIYVDRAITPLLYPSENQLRDVFRTTANPYRDRVFGDVREGLSRWLVAERVRAAEQSYLQTARSRVVLTYLVSD